MGVMDLLSGRGSESARRNEGGERKKATDLLERDHDEVKKLFRDYKSAEDHENDGEKDRLVEEITKQLTVHATIEEEIFYPEAQRVQSEEAKKLVLESREEHGIVKTLIREIGSLGEGDVRDAKMKVLMDSVEHHAEEEENELFPEVEELGDERLEEIGARLALRKAELLRSAAGGSRSRAGGREKAGSSRKKSSASSHGGRMAASSARSRSRPLTKSGKSTGSKTKSR